MGRSQSSARQARSQLRDRRDRRGPLWARSYVKMARASEARGAAEHRRRMLSGLQGRVVEVGCGDGANFRHYPASVTQVVAVEPLRYLRELAERAASTAPVRVTVQDATAEALPFPDSSFDTAVASLVLCSVAEQSTSLAEIRRVLRPGGALRFYEHVVARTRIWAMLMRVADATFWPRVAGGCHCSRDTEAALRAAGFTIEDLERFVFWPSFFEPPVPHILGSAQR